MHPLVRYLHHWQSDRSHRIDSGLCRVMVGGAVVMLCEILSSGGPAHCAVHIGVELRGTGATLPHKVRLNADGRQT
jgi:hypothetical protein